MEKKTMWAILKTEDPTIEKPYPLGGNLVLLNDEELATLWRDLHIVYSKHADWKPYPVTVIFEPEFIEDLVFQEEDANE